MIAVGIVLMVAGLLTYLLAKREKTEANGAAVFLLGVIAVGAGALWGLVRFAWRFLP